MEQFRKFCGTKPLRWCFACLLAAAAAGVWAVRTVRNELKQNLDAVRSPSSTAPGIDEGINIARRCRRGGKPNGSSRTHPQQTAWPMCQKPTASVRWGCVLFWCAVWVWFGARTLRAANRVLACQQFGCACLHARLGRVLNSYSGDELVYNKTLGDWRTQQR